MELRMRSGYSLGVSGVVLSDSQVLLVRRMHEPNRGLWTFPSGYVAVDERIDEAAVREVEEETGVRAEVRGVLGRHWKTAFWKTWVVKPSHWNRRLMG